MKKSLGDIAKDIDFLLESFDDSDEISDDLFKEFDAHSKDLEEKTDNWISFLSSIKGRIESFKEGKSRFAKNLKAASNLENRAKDYLKYVIERYPHLKLHGKDGTLRLWNSPKSLSLDVGTSEKTFLKIISVDEAKAIDPKFLIFQTIITINTKEVENALRDGEIIPWARFDQHKHVRIV